MLKTKRMVTAKLITSPIPVALLKATAIKLPTIPTKILVAILLIDSSLKTFNQSDYNLLVCFPNMNRDATKLSFRFFTYLHC